MTNASDYDDYVVSKFACSHCDAQAGAACHAWCICAKGDDQ